MRMEKIPGREKIRIADAQRMYRTRSAYRTRWYARRYTFCSSLHVLLPLRARASSSAPRRPRGKEHERSSLKRGGRTIYQRIRNYDELWIHAYITRVRACGNFHTQHRLRPIQPALLYRASMDHARSNPPKSSCDREESNPELEKAGQTHPKTETQTKDVACGSDVSSNPLSELMKYLLEPQQSFVTEPIQYRTGSNDPIVFYNYKKSEPDRTHRQTIHPDRAPNESENNSEMFDTASPSSRRQELKRRASSPKVKTFGSSTEPSDEPVSKKPMMFTEDDTSRYFFNDFDCDDVVPNDRVNSRQQMDDDHEKDRATSKSEKESKQRSELKRRASSSTIMAASSNTETLADDEPVSKKRALRLGSTKMNEDDGPRFKFFDDRKPNDRKQMDNDLREEDERIIKFTSFRSPAKSPEATDASSSDDTPDEDYSEAPPRMLNTSGEMPNQDDFQSSVSVADQLMSEITLREADMPTPRRLKIRQSLREIPEVSEDDDTNDGFDFASRAAGEPEPQRFALRQTSTRKPKRTSRPCFRATCRDRAARSSDEVSEDERTNDRASLQKQTEDDAPREADEPMSEPIAPAGASTVAPEVNPNVSVSSIHLLTPQKLEQMRSLMAELVSPQTGGTTSLTINTCFINSSPADVTLSDSVSFRSLQNREDSLPDLVDGSASKNTTAGRTAKVVASFSGGISEPKRTSEDELREAYEPVPKKLFLACASKEIVELNESSSSVEVSENDVTMDDLASSDEEMLPEDREESAPTKTTEDSEVDDTQVPVDLKMELSLQDGHHEVAESMAEKSTPEVNVLGSSVEVHEGDETIGRASLKTQTITRHINWINSCRAPSPSVTVNKQLLLKEASRKAAEPMPEKLETPPASQEIPEVNASRSSDKESEDVLGEAAAAAAATKPLPEGTSEIDDASRSSDKVPEDDETKNRANSDERTVETEFGEADEPTATKISPPRTSITKVEASHSSVERSDDAQTRDSLPPRREESIPVSEKLASTHSTETTSSAPTSCSSGNTFGNIDRPLNDGASSDKRTTEHRSIRRATKRKSDRSSAGPSSSVEQVSVGQAYVGQASVGQASVGQASVGQASVGQAYVGQVSVGQVSVGQVSSSHQSFIAPPLYNNRIISYPNYILIPQVTSSMNPQYSTAFGLVSVPTPTPPPTAPLYNYSFGNYQNPGATINATTGINYPPFRRQNYYQPTNNLIPPASQVSILYVSPSTAPVYNYPSGTYQNSEATMNGSMQNYYQPTNNLIPPAPPQVSSQYVSPPTAPFHNYPSGTYQNLDATMNGSSFHQPINNLMRPTPQVPINNLMRPTSQVPINNLIPPTSQVPINNLIPPTPQVPINNLIPPTSQVPINNLIPPTSQVPMNNLREETQAQKAQVLPSASSASSTSKLQCKRCARVFASLNELNFHMAQEHVVMRCEVCRLKPRFPTLQLLLKHMQIHKKDARENYGFMCVQCDRSCANTPALIGHMEIHAHEQLDAQRECWQANNENLLDNLENQQQQQPPAAATANTSVNTTTRFKCTEFICGETFGHQTQLYLHKMYKHGHYTCYICQIPCSDKQDFDAHMEKYHPDGWKNSK
ncbi:unnamed protein product [Trichogramma brassicae]|uniref:C2H2-type domain-containing protein n=1 Tax=Trichogramma brassicae TaxID=86971 RepID=A0A6H5IZI4_9HYME|nr:unnamed protein product [Trichogramma brassicae]